MTEANGNSGGRKPQFIAYNVQESKDGKGFFHKIGAAWPHKDGEGYDVQLESLPMDGRVTLRTLREERMQGYEEERQEQEQGQERDQTRNRSRGRSR